VRFENKYILYHLKNSIAYLLGMYNTGVVAVNSEVVGLSSGSNPSIVSYNANVVKIYNTTSSLVRFENNFLSFTLKAYHNADFALSRNFRSRPYD
jgi:hypothetical protein